jgi:SET domain-containing protein
MLQSYLYLDKTAHAGRGVFTNEDIAAGTVIEISPVIVMHKNDRIHLDKTLLHDYIFEWGHDKDKCCMALGYIPMYNHSYKSNCDYVMDYDDEVIFIQTVNAITSGEELTINYNGDWNDETKIWFDAK